MFDPWIIIGGMRPVSRRVPAFGDHDAKLGQEFATTAVASAS
jgi:hypothetical protein